MTDPTPATPDEAVARRPVSQRRERYLRAMAFPKDGMPADREREQLTLFAVPA